MTEQKVNAGTRLGTMILDHIIMTSQSQHGQRSYEARGEDQGSW